MRRTEEVTATDTAGAEAKPSADRLLDARTAWAVAVVGTLWLVSLGFLVAGYVLKPRDTSSRGTRGTPRTARSTRCGLARCGRTSGRAIC
jgi:hypothetical protein